LRLVAPADVRGLDVLDRLAPPVLFIANHESHLDTPVLLQALPPLWRRRVAVAAARDYFFRRWIIGASVGLLFNAFPVTRAEKARSTLEHCLWLKEHSWSILVYPEGTRSLSGEIGAFRQGIGLLAVELQLPVVPLRTSGLFEVLPKGRWLPRPGRAQVAFGLPLYFGPGTPARSAARTIELEVRAL
jgi:1-acyl-sn-glycerol-3-phosphate acyltransferase